MADEKNLSKRKRARLKHHDYSAEREYYLTICTHNRSPIFSRKESCTVGLKAIKHTCPECQIYLIAYCIMPDHIHLLVLPTGDISVSEFVRRFKARTACKLRKQGKLVEVWQRGFFDHIVRKDKHVNEIARYILLNPVRKGLVEYFDEYPFSGDSLNIKEEAQKTRVG